MRWPRNRAPAPRRCGGHRSTGALVSGRRRSALARTTHRRLARQLLVALTPNRHLLHTFWRQPLLMSLSRSSLRLYCRPRHHAARCRRSAPDGAGSPRVGRASLSVPTFPFPRSHLAAALPAPTTARLPRAGGHAAMADEQPVSSAMGPIFMVGKGRKARARLLKNEHIVSRSISVRTFSLFSSRPQPRGAAPTRRQRAAFYTAPHCKPGRLLLRCSRCRVRL